MDNLIQINQGGQIRSFTYDAKGRLVTQTLPENGTSTYTYTNFDAINTRTDARGVITTYSYGAMNLLTGVSYNTANASGVAATPPVSITYNNNINVPGRGQISTVTDGAGSENYEYDVLGRLIKSTIAFKKMNF